MDAMPAARKQCPGSPDGNVGASENGIQELGRGERMKVTIRRGKES